MFADRYKTRLNLQAAAGLLRRPPQVQGRDGKHLIIENRRVLNFASNDYLGLGNCERLKKAAAACFERYGTSSSSSRLVSGNYSAITEAEKRFAEYFGYAEALFFPSGYQANLGVLSALFKDGDTIIFDKHIHNSSVKGMAMGGARLHGGMMRRARKPSTATARKLKSSSEVSSRRLPSATKKAKESSRRFLQTLP